MTLTLMLDTKLYVDKLTLIGFGSDFGKTGFEFPTNFDLNQWLTYGD